MSTIYEVIGFNLLMRLLFTSYKKGPYIVFNELSSSETNQKLDKLLVNNFLLNLAFKSKY